MTTEPARLLQCLVVLGFLLSGAAAVRASPLGVGPHGVFPIESGGAMSEEGERVVAAAVRTSVSNGTTTLVVDLSRAVTAAAFLLDKPDRVIVDLPEVDVELDPAAGQLANGVGLIRTFRFGLFAPGKSRIVIDLAGPAVLRRASVEPVAGGESARLTVELGASDRASFTAALRRDAQPVAADPAPAPGPSAQTQQARPVIVIDPGHGGVDPGASGLDGATEKFVVYDFATALAGKLDASGRYSVLMTRTGDTFVSLGDRVKVARDANAALFVSVHADTLADPSVSGATVYTASDRASDAEAARVAASENKADEVGGLEDKPDVPVVSDILFDLTRRETRTYAHMFQRDLIGYWQKIARLNKRPDRAAGFKVLQAPDVPSVLLELGYLSSDHDAKLLTSAEWRDKASTAVANSIDAFFAQRRTPVVDAGQGRPAQGRQGQGRQRPENDVVSVQSHF